MKKNIFSLSFKNTTILAGVCIILLSVSIYATNQSQQGYRALTGTTGTIYTHTGTTSYNSNKIEEWGDCKVVVQNTCGKDVFIPTNTQAERNAFKAFATGTACIKLADCNTCVLKKFVEGVYAGTTTHSKVRNALSGYVNSTSTGNYQISLLGQVSYLYPNYTGDDFVIGYGLDFAIDLTTGYDGRPKIVSSDSPVAFGTASYSGINIYEFELYGITPETENSNRGCFDDGSYWVNSNVYSKQTLRYLSSTSVFSGDFTTTRFGGDIGVHFGLVFNGGFSTAVTSSNRFFGCKSELLPNPDRYCVERVVPQEGTSIEKPSAIYLKEFTNNASFSYAGCPGTGDTCLPQTNTICTALTGIANSTFQAFSTGTATTLLPMIMPSGLPNNTGFIYRNSTGANYGSQIFGFHRYSSSVYFPFVTVGVANNTHGFVIGAFYDDYYNYNDEEYYLGASHAQSNWGHNNWLGYNISSFGLGIYGVIIPLQNSNNVLAAIANPEEMYSIWNTGDINGMFDTTITKYVCVSYTCNQGYIKDSNGTCILHHEFH